MKLCFLKPYGMWATKILSPASNDLCDSLISEETTNIPLSPLDKLLPILDGYFAFGGPLANCSFEQLQKFADTTYRRYMCTAAADDTLGFVPRDPAVYRLTVQILFMTSTPSLNQNKLLTISTPLVSLLHNNSGPYLFQALILSQYCI